MDKELAEDEQEVKDGIDLVLALDTAVDAHDEVKVQSEDGTIFTVRSVVRGNISQPNSNGHTVWIKVTED
jgi:hypothetical protein